MSTIEFLEKRIRETKDLMRLSMETGRTARLGEMEEDLTALIRRLASEQRRLKEVNKGESQNSLKTIREAHE